MIIYQSNTQKGKNEKLLITCKLFVKQRLVETSYY